jgi:hypothetical protein
MSIPLPIMTQEELKEFYRKADVEDLSGLYFRNEGALKRRKHFEDLWFAIGFQSREGTFTLEKVFQLLGLPDLALGNPTDGVVGWLMQSVKSVGEQDGIVGFDVKLGTVNKFWSNSVTPECSPARVMLPFEKSEMKQATASEK